MYAVTNYSTVYKPGIAANVPDTPISPRCSCRSKGHRRTVRPVSDGITFGILKGRIVTSGGRDAFGRQTAFNMLKDALTRAVAPRQKKSYAKNVK